jgi:EmrB/QacA subfamily drug resistance transporter
MQVGRLSRPRADSMGAGRDRANAVALGALCTILFLTFLDNTIVSVGLGPLQTSLKAGVTELQWVVGAYALTFASIMLACGMIGDELGRKKVMLSGAGVFCAGSVLCALAPNAGTLIAGRAIMGLGAAASEPGTLSVLRHVYTGERERARAVGIWAAVSGLALALGPVIGGAIIGVWSWRGIFWFNLAFGLAALIIAALVVPESADPTAARVDTAGTLLGAGALATLVFGIIDAETSSFGAAVPVALFCVAAVCAAGFVWQERRAAHPLLDLRFFRMKNFAVPNVVALCAYFSTFAIFFFTALYLSSVLNDSGYRIALVFAPMTAAMILASVFAGYWTGAAGPRWPVTIGCVLFGGGLLIANPLLTLTPNYLALSLALAVAGIGLGITVVPITSTVLSAVPPDRSGMAASVSNTSREIGAVTGVAVLGALVFARLSSSLTTHLLQSSIPAADKSIVISLKPTIIQTIETGQGQIASGGYGGYSSIIKVVLTAAYESFGDGVHLALYVAAALVLLAAVLAVFTLGGGKPAPAATARLEIDVQPSS